jgi:two-component system osmolarity sensor histidine kinase EnvZ
MRKLSLKRLLPQTLFGRSFLILVLPVLFLQLISTYIFYNRHWDALSRRLSINLANDIVLLVSQMDQATPEQLENMQRILAIHLAPLSQLQWQSRMDKADTNYDMLRRELEARLEHPLFVTENDKNNNVEIFLKHNNDEYWLFSVSRKSVYSPTVYIFVLWSLGLSVVLVAVAVVFMRNQIRPLRRLAKAAENFGKGIVPPPLRPHGASEVRQATQAFNEMQERIQRQIHQRTAMLAAISHDLRTPLTRMRLQIALSQPFSGADDMLIDITEMEQMIDAYLSFARNEEPEKTVLTSLKELLHDIVAGVPEPRKITISSMTDQLVQVRVQALKRCLRNLLTNACRHAARVAVQCEIDGKHVNIHVDDDGIGIPPEHYESVFRPFYRLEESRNLETGGVGLGLTIARDIARSHGGDILLARSPQGGLRATLRLVI